MAEMTIKVDTTEVQALIDDALALIKPVAEAQRHLQELCERIRRAPEVNNMESLREYVYKLEVMGLVDRNRYQR